MMTAPKFTPRIHVRITFVVRTSLAGISALPKVHLTHVLLPWLQRYCFSAKIKALKFVFIKAI